MSLGVQMSFSMKRANWKTALLVIVFATIGFLAPAGYLAWWGLLGGRNKEIRRTIERLIQQNPAGEAASAIKNHDYRLYGTGGVLDAKAPGVGWTDDAYLNTFGYRSITTLEGDSLSAEQARLNRAAIQYMTEYNAIVYEEANRIHPNWYEEYERKKRRFESH